jgi:hypothetical protein
LVQGVGLAGGSEIYERMGQLAGAEIDRDLREYATTRGTEFALGASSTNCWAFIIKRN